MVIKVTYGNGCWEYFKNITSIEQTVESNILVINKKVKIRLDNRIKYEIVDIAPSASIEN